MNITEYCDEIEFSLGAPIVEIEVKPYIERYVQRAFRELKRFILEMLLI